MTETVQKMLDQALVLTPQERGLMASRLLESLDDETDAISPEEWDEAWSREIASRIKRVDAGQERMIPWEEVERSLNVDDSEES